MGFYCIYIKHNRDNKCSLRADPLQGVTYEGERLTVAALWWRTKGQARCRQTLYPSMDANSAPQDLYLFNPRWRRQWQLSYCYINTLELEKVIATQLKATFSFHKITTKKPLKCLSYILICHFTWPLQWFIILDMNNLVKVSHHYQSSWNQHEQQNGGLPFQTRQVQQGIPRN